jgi:hypothetical protein
MVTAHKGAYEVTATELGEQLEVCKATMLKALSKLHFSSIQPMFYPSLMEA